MGWPEAPSLLVTYAGSPAGRAALAPALRRLRRLANATLLGPEPERPIPPGVWGAIIFTEPGWSALEIGYALFCAGVPRRAGYATEFGGGVLTTKVKLIPGLTPAAHHDALLSALGFGTATRYKSVHENILRDGVET